MTSAYIRNIVVVGKSDISAAILHALSHASYCPGDRQSSNLPQPLHAHQNGDNGNLNDIHHESVPSSYNLTLLIRPHESPPPLCSVNHHEIAYNHGDLTSAFRNASADVVISAIAPADVPFQKNLIDAAIAAHVRHPIPCEFSYDTEHSEVKEAYPPAKARAEILEYLREKREIQYTGIATGCLLGVTKGLLGFDLPWITATIYGTGDEKFPCSTLPWIGDVVLQVLEDLRRENNDGQPRYLKRPEVVSCQNKLWLR